MLVYVLEQQRKDGTWYVDGAVSNEDVAKLYNSIDAAHRRHSGVWLNDSYLLHAINVGQGLVSNEEK